MQIIQQGTILITYEKKKKKTRAWTRMVRSGHNLDMW